MACQKWSKKVFHLQQTVAEDGWKGVEDCDPERCPATFATVLTELGKVCFYEEDSGRVDIIHHQSWGPRGNKGDQGSGVAEGWTAAGVSIL